MSKENTKRRNAQAVAAWNRHAGAHDPGSKKPEESLEEYLKSWEEEPEEEKED